MNLCSPQHRCRGWRVDAAIILALAAAWLGFVGAVTGGKRTIYYDTFRDMAWAENIRAGRVWADPALPDQPYWYAPGNPLLMAGVAIVTGRPVVDVYAYSAFWCNALLPILLYLLVRVVWDRTTAIVALPAVFLGSFWWLTHAVAGIPGIQGLALNLVGLLCWHRCLATAQAAGTDQPRRPGWVWPVLTGVVLSLSAWHHPLCAIVLAGAIFLHAAMDFVITGLGKQAVPWRGRIRYALPGRMLVVAAVAGALTAPLIVHMLGVQMKNPWLLRYFASELIDPDYYAHAHVPLVVLCASLGVWFVMRKSPCTLWIVAYLLAGLIGQAAGYLGQSPHWYIPYALPHEFQWHGQLALGICAAVGITGLARAIAARLTLPPRSRLIVPLSAALLCVAVFGPALRELSRTDDDLLDLEPLLADTRELCTWIRANTGLEATFVCHREMAYQVVSGLTGRKCIVVSPGHTNPSVDLRRRLNDLDTMLRATDAEAFARLAADYGATHLLLPIAGPEDLPEVRRRYDAWPCLEPVFVASDGTALVYRILLREPGEPADTQQRRKREGVNEP